MLTFFNGPSIWRMETRAAETSSGLCMAMWGALNFVHGSPISQHAFGAELHWIDKTHLEMLFMMVGSLQTVGVILNHRWMRLLCAFPALILNLNVVIGVLFSGIYPYGAVSYYIGASAMNAFAISHICRRIRAT